MVRRGRSPGREGLGGPGRQRSPRDLGFGPHQSPSSISCQPSLLGHPVLASVHESSSSICPAPRDECGGLHIPPVSQQQAQMSPRVAGMGSGAGLALAPCAGSRRQSGNEGTWALRSRVRIPLPGHLAGAGLALPPGHGHIQPCPRPAHNPRSRRSWFSFWKKLLPNS